jgi:hypothetical protein
MEAELIAQKRGGPYCAPTRFAEELRRAPEAGDFGVNLATFADLA